jgi:hypothetical protein
MWTSGGAGGASRRQRIAKVLAEKAVQLHLVSKEGLSAAEQGLLDSKAFRRTVFNKAMGKTPGLVLPGSKKPFMIRGSDGSWYEGTPGNVEGRTVYSPPKTPGGYGDPNATYGSAPKPAPGSFKRDPATGKKIQAGAKIPGGSSRATGHARAEKAVKAYNKKLGKQRTGNAKKYGGEGGSMRYQQDKYRQGLKGAGYNPKNPL